MPAHTQVFCQDWHKQDLSEGLDSWICVTLEPCLGSGRILSLRKTQPPKLLEPKHIKNLSSFQLCDLRYILDHLESKFSTLPIGVSGLVWWQKPVTSALKSGEREQLLLFQPEIHSKSLSQVSE